ncbi:uncharacterized protein EV420DRAFT_106519 [Desarmillaria tabescens]|uniref:F-box domain-containing protein n=1 Tax=Armillaria tabescens TaxID=1929756 RepID=A0AA39NR74_ARMTA|nr:uncharacterized protein EV420DRAFT_106519 [Desarmillaria tabescens]KAK0470326.1 hypothetical protein EV420DRAFT_106519 [Desarmillaria tabescens]
MPAGLTGDTKVVKSNGHTIIPFCAGAGEQRSFTLHNCASCIYILVSILQASIRMSIHSISREIVDSILEGLDSNTDRDSIRALSRVSRSFRSHCLRILFSVLSFHPPSSPHVPTTCRSFYNLVQSIPHIPSLVRTLNIREGTQDHLWIPTEPTFPDVMRALVNVTAISMVFVKISSLPEASRSAITNQRLTRIHLDSVHFRSDDEFRALLRYSSDSLEILDLGNITFDSGTRSSDGSMRIQPAECRLTMLMLDVQSEGDAEVLNILFGLHPPIRMDMVEKLWLTEVCISSDAVVEGLDKLWNCLVVSGGGMLASISVGDCHGLEEALRPVTLNGISEISFLTTTSGSVGFSPSLQWWSNNFSRAAVATEGWEPDEITIILQLETGSSAPLVSLFDDESIDAWTRMDTSLCGVGVIGTPAVEVRIILDANHDSTSDFLFMQSWVRRQLPMLHEGRFLQVRQAMGDL